VTGRDSSFRKREGRHRIRNRSGRRRRRALLARERARGSGERVGDGRCARGVSRRSTVDARGVGHRPPGVVGANMGALRADEAASRRARARERAYEDVGTFESFESSDRRPGAFEARVRASAAYARAGSATRLLCDAAGTSRSVTRVKNPSVRDLDALRDETARARAMEALRADVRRGWAKESACRGALATKAERYDEAERCFAQAIELDPMSVRAYVARGACRANQRKYAEAMADFDKALSVDADDATAKSYRAAVEDKMRRVRRARGASVARQRGDAEPSNEEDVERLRARVLNPARGLDALARRDAATKTYELELDDDDDDDDADAGRRDRKRKKEKSRKKDRRDRKERKDRKRSRRERSSRSSSSS
jgi:tetratricopeptide (TPR) repeat protein